MAQVASREDIDEAIGHQLRAWRTVADYAEWWPELDEVDRLDFRAEWLDLTEARLRELQSWTPYFTPDQRTRYEQLLELIARFRPALDRLLAT